MPTARISKRSVDALVCPPDKDRIILWDESLAGFGLVAFASGAKSYIAQYRQGGRSRRVNLGKHGRLTADEARSAAKRVLGQVEAGVDPIAEKRDRLEGETFATVASQYMSPASALRLKPRTQAEYVRLLRKWVLPEIGNIRIKDISRADVARLHSQISSSAPVAANRAVAVISAIWSWAARRDIVPSDRNPAKGIERNPEQGKERFLSAAELGRLGEALKLAETTGIPWRVDPSGTNAKHAPKPENQRTIIDPFAIAALKLLLVTGARLNEILKVEWASVDLDRGIIFLPDSKTGRKPIYLSSAAIQIVQSIPRIAGNRYLIAGSRPGRPRADLKKPWAAIRAAAGLQDVRLHDLRHTYASIGVGSALGLPVIGKLLGHARSSTTERYAHLDADPLHRAVEQIGANLANALEARNTSAK